jgi:predicted nucleic acid-binding protein
MKCLVLDASASVKAALGDQTLLDKIKKADRVIAPDLYISEISNVFWKYHHIMKMPETDCVSAMNLCLNIPDIFISGIELANNAFHLACLHKKPSYDMHYLVLAKMEKATLLTCDKILKNLAIKHNIPT